ncbi:MAG: bifunctional heptose 7-phosphate kinase/heptose 1-phosphate adenyltransferase, partial [Desulfobacterales bacterium]|nr:bifunctional heptose 7-phosphate kinase/heptose 1-phosphate adenyltransferase [Desulfobacterales bacterium]
MNLDISKFERCKILVVGDLMIDEYLWGSVERISPEAPVQVVSVENQEYTPGGSGNVVNNLVALGAKVIA